MIEVGVLAGMYVGKNSAGAVLRSMNLNFF